MNPKKTQGELLSSTEHHPWLNIPCRYKQRVLCYILSHVVGCPLPEVKIALLRTLEEVSNNAKSQILQPELSSLSKKSTFAHMQDTFGTSCEEFAALIVASIDESACTRLNAKDTTFWTIYLAILRQFFYSGEYATIPVESGSQSPQDAMSSPRLVLTQRLQSTVFAALELDRKVQLCRTFLEVAQQSEVVSSYRHEIISDLS